MDKLIKLESEVWREVARRIAEDEYFDTGFCAVLRGMQEAAVICNETMWDAQDRLLLYRDYDEEFSGGHVCYILPKGDKARVGIALWLALDAEWEGK
jgi:hypothetical protein